MAVVVLSKDTVNFKLLIKQSGKPDITFDLHDAVITVSQRECDDLLKIKCIVRPDCFLQTRANAVSKSGVQLTHATVIQSDPVKDPNHWLKRDDTVVGKYTKIEPDSGTVRSRRHYARKGRNGS